MSRNCFCRLFFCSSNFFLQSVSSYLAILLETTSSSHRNSLRFLAFPRTLLLTEQFHLRTQLLELFFLTTTRGRRPLVPLFVLRRNGLLMLPLQTCWNVRKTSPATPPRAKLTLPFFLVINRNGIRQNLLGADLSRYPGLASLCLDPIAAHTQPEISTKNAAKTTQATKRGSRRNRDGTQNQKHTPQKPHPGMCVRVPARLECGWA